jgi:hypothetical protein
MNIASKYTFKKINGFLASVHIKHGLQGLLIEIFYNKLGLCSATCGFSAPQLCADTLGGIAKNDLQIPNNEL